MFGCDISIYGEGSVKIWTIFGTSLGFVDHLKGYRSVNAFALSQRYSIAEEAKNLLRLIAHIPIIIYRAKKMTKPWNWSDFERYLDRPIDDIRREYNIEVLN